MASSDNMLTILIAILIIDLVLFLGQVSITQIEPNGNTYFHSENSLLMSFNEGSNGEYILTNNVSGILPDAENSMSDDGTVFTDIFKSIKSWFSPTGPISTGINYFTSFLGGPTSYVKEIVAPLGQSGNYISYSIGALWWGITILVITSYLFGR